MNAPKGEFVGSYFWKVKTFLNAPVVKFTYGFISYVGYLILFSIVMLTDFKPKMSPLEMALNVWTLILIIEEIKQIIVHKREYNNEWNYFDVGALLTYIVGFILRMIYLGDPAICPTCLYVARIVLAFSLMIFIFRALQFLSVGETLGPQIYMIRRLLADLINFMLILTVFISAYGVVSNVILYPNQPLNAKLLQDVYYDAWWSLVLNFDLDETLGLNCDAKFSVENNCSSTTWNDINYALCKKNHCPANTWIVSILLAFYALLTIIMMLSILIAIFVMTSSTVTEKQKSVSKMQRYRLIREYSSHSMVPTPLCVVTYPFIIGKYLLNLCVYWLEDDDHSSAYSANRIFPSSDEHHDDFEREQRGTRPMLSRSPPKAFAKNVNSRVKDWEHRIVEEYCKRNKDDWSMARMDPEKSSTDQFDETPLGRYIIQQIRNQMTEQHFSAETDVKVNRNDSGCHNKDEK